MLLQTNQLIYHYTKFVSSYYGFSNSVIGIILLSISISMTIYLQYGHYSFGTTAF